MTLRAAVPTGSAPSATRANVGPRALACALAFLLLGLVPGRASAQALTGAVMDADSGQPVAGAEVRLLDTGSATLDAVRTADDGRFRLEAPGPGSYILHVRLEGHLTYTDAVDLDAAETLDRDVTMPLISTAAARVMHDVIHRESAFRLPWEELCDEPVRPWEAGVLVGVSRERSTLDPIAGAVVRLEPVDGEDGDTRPRDAWPRTRVATATGAFWFCNVPEGRARIVCRRYAERRAVSLDERLRPVCYDADHPDCQGCVEDIDAGTIETW